MVDGVQQDGLAHLRGDIADLTASVDTLSQGLRLMLETQETHTEMLTALLKAAAKPEEESALEILLAQIVADLEGQTESLSRLETGIVRMGHDVEDAVIRGMQLALGDGIDVDEPARAERGEGA
jgi:hypothetical protein